MKHLLLILALLIPTTALPDTLQLNWELPTERADNFPLLPEEIASIDVYDNQIQVTNFQSYPLPGSSIAVIVNVTTPGLHNFTLRTRDTENRTSVDSNTISYQVKDRPKPPVLLGVTRID